MIWWNPGPPGVPHRRLCGVIRRPSLVKTRRRAIPPEQTYFVLPSHKVRKALEVHWGLVATSLLPISSGMNSSGWDVTAGDRFFAKVVPAGDHLDPGLFVAEHLAERGFRVGPPVRSRAGTASVVVGGARIAVLRWEDGDPLIIEREDHLRAIGRTLGGVHAQLLGTWRPTGLTPWPWTWLRQGEQLDFEAWLRPMVHELLNDCEAAVASGALPVGVVHGDPNRTEFLAHGDGIALIDWGACIEAPLLFDLASFHVLSHTTESQLVLVMDAYRAVRPLDDAEEAFLPLLIDLRLAIQAWYFAWRLLNKVHTGGVEDDFNRAGWTRSKEVLLRRIPMGERP